MLLFSDFYAFYGSSACSACASSYLIDSCFRCLHLLAGGSPAATHFSLLRQRKVSKRKATRLSGSLRCPRKTGVGANSLHFATLKQRAALIPFFWGITGPARTGLAGIKSKPPDSHRARISSLHAIDLIADCADGVCAKGTFDAQAPAPASESVPASPVLAGPVMTGKSGIRAARCLRRRRVCADPRFCRSLQVARSEAQGPRQPGRLFFGEFLLAKQKKVTCRRATPGQQNQEKLQNHKIAAKRIAGTRP
jgi:hypothetical protein